MLASLWLICVNWYYLICMFLYGLGEDLLHAFSKKKTKKTFSYDLHHTNLHEIATSWNVRCPVSWDTPLGNSCCGIQPTIRACSGMVAGHGPSALRPWARHLTPGCSMGIVSILMCLEEKLLLSGYFFKNCLYLLRCIVQRQFIFLLPFSVFFHHQVYMQLGKWLASSLKTNFTSKCCISPCKI